MSTITTTVTLPGLDVDAEVTGTYVKGTPDVRYRRNGDPGEPGDPAEVEVESVTLTGNKGERLDVDLRGLTQRDGDACRESIVDAGEGDYDDDGDPDVAYEAARDRAQGRW